MRPRHLAAMAALWFVAGAFAQDRPAPLKEDLTPSLVPRIAVFVPPDYPAGALDDSVTAVVDVFGKVQGDGGMAIDRIEATPDRDDFRQAVREVSRFWMFIPRYDSRCEPLVEEKQFRIWFELKEGKPAISISGAVTGKAPTDTSQEDLFTPITKVTPEYPYRAQRDGREGAVDALIRIAEDGHVEKVVVIPGPQAPFFAEAITNAMLRWRFPEGKRLKQCARYEFLFRLTGTRSARFF